MTVITWTLAAWAIAATVVWLRCEYVLVDMADVVDGQEEIIVRLTTTIERWTADELQIEIDNDGNATIGDVSIRLDFPIKDKAKGIRSE